jgi:hypothetical protein
MADGDGKYRTFDKVTTATDHDLAYATIDYRDYLYPVDHEHVADFRNLDARAYAEFRLRAVHVLRESIEGWKPLLESPFVGITTDGVVRPGLFGHEEPASDEYAPTSAMVAAADRVLASLDADLRERYRYPIDAIEWRQWSNPEVLVFDNGLRLDEIDEMQRGAILDLMGVSLGSEGFELLRMAMRLNGLIGELTELPLVMNEFSYHASLFGEPSETEPWGWQLYGHHVGMNVVVVGNRMVVSPVFLGAEPTYADAGPLSGHTAFSVRHALALELVASLTAAQLAIARAFETMRSAQMPEGRLHPLDERHLAGAFADNRVVPYEGVRVAELEPGSQDLVLRIVDDFLALLPDGPRRARLREVTRYLDETYLTWIGGSEVTTPFYFRIQSPVILVEFDHHSGVWLSNDLPATFHTHTTMRTPNGNDYGYAIRGA